MWYLVESLAKIQSFSMEGGKGFLRDAWLPQN